MAETPKICLSVLYAVCGVSAFFAGTAGVLGADVSPGTAPAENLTIDHSMHHPMDRTIQLAAGAPAPTAAAGVPATQPTTQPPARTAEQRKQDDINRVMNFFAVTQPDVYKQAQALRTTDRESFDKLIMGALHTVNNLEQIKKRNPKLFDLSMQDLQMGYKALDISHQLKREDLPEPERNMLLQQLGGIVAAEFDVQQKIRQIELDDLQARVKDLENQAKAREKDRDKRIQARLEDLIKRNAKLEWEAPKPSAAPPSGSQK